MLSNVWQDGNFSLMLMTNEKMWQKSLLSMRNIFFFFFSDFDFQFGNACGSENQEEIFLRVEKLEMFFTFPLESFFSTRF